MLVILAITYGLIQQTLKIILLVELVIYLPLLQQAYQNGKRIFEIGSIFDIDNEYLKHQ